MLSAPAGFGKTYLLSQWADLLRGRNILTAWCALTIDDRERRVLWNSIVDALVEATREVAGPVAERLMTLSPELEPLGHSAFLASFFSIIADYPGTMVLIVDNADILEESDSGEELISFLEGAPTNLHVALATRSALQTKSARVSGRLVELTADSLSFSRTETEELFALRGFTDTDIDQIYYQAEGWPAALSLAVLRVTRIDDATSVIDNWNDPSVLYDYLRQEVFADLSENERAVLLTMGVAPLTTPELVEALGGGDDSPAVLRCLASNNRLLYRVSVDASGHTWYRVQRLFGSFLREQLRELQPTRLSEMIAQAVAWYTEHGDAFTALQLAIDPPNAALVDAVLRARGYEIVGDGHSLELLAMMPSATSEAMRGPFARAMMAYAAACASLADRAREFLSAPHVDGLEADDLLEWDWLNYLTHLQLAVSASHPIDLVMSGWGEESLDRVPEPLRLAIRLTRGLAEARSGRTRRATDTLRVALAQAENDEDLSRMLLSTVGLAGAAVSECDFRRAIALCDQVFELASRSTTQNQNGSRSTAHGIAAWSHFELLDIPAARDHATRSVELAEEQNDQDVRLQARHVYNDTMFESLPQKRRVAQEFVTAWPPAYLRGISHVSVIASLHAGMRMAAYLDEPRWSERLLDRARQTIGEGTDWQVAYALHLLAIGRDDAARNVVAPLIETPVPLVKLSSIIVASIDAVLKSRSNNAYQAHAAIYRALELADEVGAYREVGRSDARTVARILADGTGRFGPHEHIAKLLLSGDMGESMLNSGPLTARERQVLGELRTLRTVEEIAHDLLLSVNTVKTHMRGIYRKLDVTSRRQAVVKAERYGLI